jgi:hypothetical protein
MSPIRRKSESPLPVGSVASQSTIAAAAWVRVTLQLPEPSPVSGSSGRHSEPFDFRWLTTTVSLCPDELCANVWASEGRLRVSMKRGSTAEVMIFQSPTGATEPGF